MNVARIFTIVIASSVLAAAVVSIVGCGGSSSSSGPQTFTQFDRIGRPEVAEICLTVANGQSQACATSSPSTDVTNLKPGIAAFVTHAAGRSVALANSAAALLSPDVLEADIGQAGPASYLGIELNNQLNPVARFGGRKLSDDVVTTDFTLFFGNTLGNDGASTPGLTTDNVMASTAPKHYRDGSTAAAVAFPYLGVPQ